MTQLGKYELHEQLGRGGFGIVYRATDTSLDREVAIKVLHPQLMVDETFVERFKKEARILAALDHPSIVTIHEMGEVDGRVFIAMKYLSGGSLQNRIQKDGVIAIKETLKIMRQVCEGLQSAHEQGMVHRDLKPANILFDQRGNAVISDFGLARVVQASGASSSMGVVGTPAYRAPELWRGKPPATPATDVYSLGCILAEMLTGKMLFDGQTPDEILTQHLIDGPQFPEPWPDYVPIEIINIIHQTLNKDCSQRFSDAHEFLIQIERTENKTSSYSSNIKKMDDDEKDAVIINNTNISIEKSGKKNKTEKLELNTITEFSEDKIKLHFSPHIGVDFIKIPAGEFLMGSRDDQLSNVDEKPQHTVYLKEYWISKFPITNEQFGFYLKEAYPQVFEKWRSIHLIPPKVKYPVTFTNWFKANEFCKWMTSRVRYDVMLPSEAQWEKAARGKDGLIYPWGNQEPDDSLCNFNNNCGGESNVGQFSPKGDSPYGCADMAGNVSEWVNDWYEENYYSKSSRKNPVGPGSGSHRIVRGGSWIFVADYCRCTKRMHLDPSTTSTDLGFRCVLSS